MPLPECDPSLSYYQRELAGVIDNRMASLPIHYYHSGGRHVTPEGSVPLSMIIANEILERLEVRQQVEAR